MPLYEYRCEACGHRFEIIQKFSDRPLEECPKCKGRVSKLQSAPAFQFKGTGWYITDYARKDAGSSGKSEAGAGEASSGDTAAAKGETAEKKGEKPPETNAKNSKDAQSAATTASAPAAKPAGEKGGS